MKLHFAWKGVERLLEEIKTATTAKTLYGEETGKGLWLVGDTGVYLMANTSDGVHNIKMAKCDNHFVVYADECNPEKMDVDEWWDIKRDSFGGDDGIHFISIDEIESMSKKESSSEYTLSSLCIDFAPEEPTISLIWKRKQGRKK